jgi:outer membrane protein assembly complex protein YaeT
MQQRDDFRRTAQIVIPVSEGSLFHVGSLAFSGNTAITAEDLRSGLPLDSDGVFEPSRVEPTVAALKLKYGKLGYGDADIDYDIVRHDDRATVDVTYNITENKRTSIGSVKVEGTRKTSPEFVRSQLLVGEGDVANTTLIRESARNLSQTGAYASTDIQLQPPVEAGASDRRMQVADMVVALAEPKPYRVLYGGLYDSGGGPGFIADLQNLNGLGPGRTLGLRTRFDPDTHEVRLYLTRPFWRQRRLSTTISTYYTRETLQYQTVPTEKLGVSFQQDYPFRSSRWLLSYGYRFERQRGFVPDPAAPDIPETVVNVAPLTFTTSRDTRDSFLDATKGSFISHGIEYAPKFLGSDYPYFRYYVQLFKYWALTHPRPVPFGQPVDRPRFIFASGSRIGLQKGFNETGAVLTDRFYAGGGTTVRGFKQDELGPKLANGQPAGGNAVLVLNEELRYPLFAFLDAVSFIDIGNVFPRVTDFKFSELRAAGGFGLRIRNPFIVLRFDYGFKFDRRPGESRGAFFFSIGQAF